MQMAATGFPAATIALARPWATGSSKYCSAPPPPTKTRRSISSAFTSLSKISGRTRAPSFPSAHPVVVEAVTTLIPAFSSTSLGTRYSSSRKIFSAITSTAVFATFFTSFPRSFPIQSPFKSFPKFLLSQPFNGGPDPLENPRFSYGLHGLEKTGHGCSPGDRHPDRHKEGPGFYPQFRGEPAQNLL